MALFEVIKKKKDDGNLVSMYPKTNFNTGSQLIVDESQEALFFSTGKALDLFKRGKYTLSTNNIPLLRGVLNIPTGFKTPFTCKIYFIDITEQHTKWGTPSKIEFLEPIYNIPIQIGACGEFRFKVVDSRKLILKLVGIKNDFTCENIDDFFASEILIKVKSYLANFISENKISIFEIDRKLEEISRNLTEKLKGDFLEYGIDLKDFFITTILKPEDNKQYLELKELYFKQGVGIFSAKADKDIAMINADIEAQKNIIASKAKAISREQEGYTYQEEKQYEINKELAKNEAIGQFSNVGIGIGLMGGLGSTIGNKVSEKIVGAYSDNKNQVCPKCNEVNDINAKFCKKCGSELGEKRCTNCGAELSFDAVYCSKCGKRVI